MGKIQTIINFSGLKHDLGYPQFNYSIMRITQAIDDLKEIVKGKSYTASAGDKIYIISGCDIPRFKVKQFCQTNKVALVKFEDRATAKFIGPDVVNELIIQDSDYKMEKVGMLDYLYKVVGTEDPRYIPMLKDIVDSESDYILMNTSMREELQSKNTFQLKLFPDNTIRDQKLRHGYYTRFKNDEAYATYMNYCKDSRIFHQDDILRVLNTGTVMDDEMYESIKRLFDSTDKQNTQVAMEAMSNCDYEASAVPLLLLMKEYGEKMNNSPSRYHVNFKSLMKYFDISNLATISLDTIVNSLKHQNILTTENVERLLPLARAQIDRQLQLKSFQVTDVQLHSKFKPDVLESITPAGAVEVLDDDDELEELNPYIEGLVS